MNQIVRLNSKQEAILDDAADRFIALYHGDIRKRTTSGDFISAKSTAVSR